MGYLVLQGGDEFGGQMEISDRRAIELAGGEHAPISIIPTAAAPDNNHVRAGRNGRNWFHSLGAKQVSVSGVIDSRSADDLIIAEHLRHAKLIYLLGGFPAYLAETLKETQSWRAVVAAFNRGAVLAGSSAGAMVLCDYFYDPYQTRVYQGLGLLSGCCILPHHNAFGHRWVSGLQKELPGAALIGIDEQTAMIDDGPNGFWNVYGHGDVTVYRNQKTARHTTGSSFKL